MTEQQQEECREYTKDEVLEMFMDNVRAIVRYWQNESRSDRNEAVSGVAHSLLSLLDGVHGGFPAINMVVSPHPDDKEFCKAEGENWFPASPQAASDAMFNDCHLHEMLYRGGVV